MEINHNYFLLLKEIGLNVDENDFNKPKDPIPPWRCCENPDVGEITNEFYNNEGYYCVNCNVVQRERKLEHDIFRKHVEGEALGMSETCVMKQKKRSYVPITHFREHLRRYMGARFTEPSKILKTIHGSLLDISENIIVDVNDKDAYFVVQKQLKQMGLHSLYKEIFTIIYRKGGINPKVDYTVFEKCISEFKILMYHFLRNKEMWGRHSMPSIYMMMDILLRENGHVPYYNIPKLKDLALREKVVSIYRDLKDIKIEYNNE